MIKRLTGAMVAESFKERFEEFKKTKWAIPTALVLTTVVTATVLLTAWYLCFSYALITVLAFAIPYYFGFKNLKKLALFGLVLFLILGVLFGIYSAGYYRGLEGSPVESSDGLLTNGTFEQTGASQYQYTVLLTGGNGSEHVALIIEDEWVSRIAFNETMDPWGSPTSDGQVYVKNMTLDKTDLYGYFFATETTEKWVFTSFAGIGPIRVPDTDFYVSWIISDLLVVYLNIAVLFFILLGLVWWTKSSREKYERMKEERDEMALPKTKEESPIEEVGTVTEEKFVCSECGVEVPPDASECPQCGESFEEEEAKVEQEKEAKVKEKEGLKCPACGADLFETDKKCWNCGKKLK